VSHDKYAGETDRQMDGKQTITVCFLLDTASITRPFYHYCINMLWTYPNLCRISQVAYNHSKYKWKCIQLK